MAFILYIERHWTWKLNKNLNGSNDSDRQTKNINQHSCFAAQPPAHKYAHSSPSKIDRFLCVYVLYSWSHLKCDKSSNYSSYLRFNGNLKRPYTHTHESSSVEKNQTKEEEKNTNENANVNEAYETCIQKDSKCKSRMMCICIFVSVSVCDWYRKWLLIVKWRYAWITILKLMLA